MQSPEARSPGPPGSSLAQSFQSEKLPPLADPRHGRRWWHSRGYLPHFESTTAVQHITFRLADSLPKHVVAGLAEELKNLPPTRQGILRRIRIENYMDAGHGSCVLRVPEIAQMVQDSLLHGDGNRYRILAWVIMPNHVHTLIEPLPSWTIARIVASWKSFTGRRISAWQHSARLEPGGPGPGSDSQVWHREYWDRFARDEAHLAHFIDYIHKNPVKANLVAAPENWPWSSAHQHHSR